MSNMPLFDEMLDNFQTFSDRQKMRLLINLIK